MSKILIVAEHANGQAQPATAKCVTARRRCRRRAIDVVVLAADPAGVAAQAAHSPASPACCTVANAANAHASPRCSRRRSPPRRGYTHVFGPAPPSART
jgi:electron transfer flavoprotein alpha subunit